MFVYLQEIEANMYEVLFCFFQFSICIIQKVMPELYRLFLISFLSLCFAYSNCLFQ